MTRTDALALSTALVVRYIRVEELHLTQEAVAARMGVTRPYYSNIERAYRVLTLPVFDALANALDIPTGTLMDRVVAFADSDLEHYLND